MIKEHASESGVSMLSLTNRSFESNWSEHEASFMFVGVTDNEQVLQYILATLTTSEVVQDKFNSNSCGGIGVFYVKYDVNGTDTYADVDTGVYTDLYTYMYRYYIYFIFDSIGRIHTMYPREWDDDTLPCKDDF